MSDQIQDRIEVSASAGEVRISVSGVGSMIGLLHVLSAAKFQTGMEWRVLLSPFVRDIQMALVESLSKDPRFKNLGESSIDANDQQTIAAHVREYMSGVEGDKSFEDLLAVAVFPFKPSSDA